MSMAFQEKKNRRNPEKKPHSAGDDRNLVLVDEDFQDADFEDRVWLYWQRHGKKTVAIAVLVFLAIIGTIVYVEVGKMRLAALQNEFANAQTTEQKLAFAAANTSDTIAGTAYFAAGNELFSAEKYSEAAEAYGNAARVFSREEKTASMGARAQIAQASALARAKDGLAPALALLKTLAGTPSADPLYRGQAMYALAAEALSAGNLAEARLWLNEIERALPPQNVWRPQAQVLIEIEPKLASDVVAAGTPATQEAL